MIAVMHPGAPIETFSGQRFNKKRPLKCLTRKYNSIDNAVSTKNRRINNDDNGPRLQTTFSNVPRECTIVLIILTPSKIRNVLRMTVVVTSRLPKECGCVCIRRTMADGDACRACGDFVFLESVARFVLIFTRVAALP